MQGCTHTRSHGWKWEKRGVDLCHFPSVCVVMAFLVIIVLRGVYTMIHVRRTCAPHMYAAHVR